MFKLNKIKFSLMCFNKVYNVLENVVDIVK